MYLCRLFHRDRPAEQIDARLLADGALTIGRDPDVDWPLADPEQLLSRLHCTLSVRDGALALHDSSTNGTFVDGIGRVPRGTSVGLAPLAAVRLGALTLLVDRPPDGRPNDTTVVPVPAVPALAWDGPAAPPPAAHPDAPLLDAFCEGAALDVSSFADEDPAVLMRRLGGIYRQAVLGLAAATLQRAEMKEAQALDRTTLGPAGNNPVRWTAPRRLGEDLLRGRDDSYLEGADAVERSFADLSAHVRGLAAAINGTVAMVLDRLDPVAIAAEVAAQPGIAWRGHAAPRLALHEERHRRLRDGGAVELFRQAYRDAEEAAARPLTPR